MADTFFPSNNTTFEIESKKNEKIIVHISGTPTVSSIDDFLRLMKNHGVTDTFCFCKLSYDPEITKKYCINFHHLEFEDGKSPDEDTIKKFNILMAEIIRTAKIKNQVPNVNMHCQAGMGRAPTFLAYLMISKYDWNNSESVDHIRKLRRGSFNKTQLNWIIDLKLPKTKKQCVLM